MPESTETILGRIDERLKNIEESTKQINPLCDRVTSLEATSHTHEKSIDALFSRAWQVALIAIGAVIAALASLITGGHKP